MEAGGLQTCRPHQVFSSPRSNKAFIASACNMCPSDPPNGGTGFASLAFRTEVLHPFPTTFRCSQALQLQHLPPTTAPCLCPAMPSSARRQLLQPYNPVNLGLPFSAVSHLYLDRKLFCSEMGSGRALKQSRRSGSCARRKKVLRR